jgi:pimeloyl-ACP methyl ester carboxylesterase
VPTLRRFNQLWTLEPGGRDHSDSGPSVQRGHHRLPEVGEFVDRNIPNSQMIVLKATGHCPNLSAPEEVIAAMRTFV